MNGLTEVILISQVPLPFSKIGSWTTLYTNYFLNDHKIDYLICPKPEKLYDNVNYSFANINFWQKFQNKVFKKQKTEYLKALDKIIQPDNNYIIQIVDNYGMVKPLHRYLVSRGVIKKCYIQFFYHGFSPYDQLNSGPDFYELINELIVLTQDSYKQFKNRIHVLPCHFSVLHNGIETQKFKKVSISDKENLKQKFELENKKVFIWCSQERPKKGLHIVLDAWKKVYETEKNIILLVIGTEKNMIFPE